MALTIYQTETETSMSEPNLNENLPTMDALLREVGAAGASVRLYSGRPGCMCGCRGTYSTLASPGAHRVLGNMRKMWDASPVTRDYDTTSLPDLIYYVESDTRCYALYVDYPKDYREHQFRPMPD